MAKNTSRTNSLAKLQESTSKQQFLGINQNPLLCSQDNEVQQSSMFDNQNVWASNDAAYAQVQNMIQPKYANTF